MQTQEPIYSSSAQKASPSQAHSGAPPICRLCLRHTDMLLTPTDMPGTFPGLMVAAPYLQSSSCSCWFWAWRPRDRKTKLKKAYVSVKELESPFLCPQLLPNGKICITQHSSQYLLLSLPYLYPSLLPGTVEQLSLQGRGQNPPAAAFI